MTTPLPAKLNLPADLVSAIYFCPACQGKHTFGAAYFTETGKDPDLCPGCSAPLKTEDRVLRVEGDDEALMEARKTDLFARRGLTLPARPKPADPGELRRQRVRELEKELEGLKSVHGAAEEAG
ncbi:hypothetical protein [Nonomuraea typhae]|uniref:hypothetical protein n=1 Tax=Nonomuraea typhae TaxID=2603600 RepID=UPI0012F9DD3C|nr:hypothetical protein [Nonomuraea typhae]